MRFRGFGGVQFGVDAVAAKNFGAVVVGVLQENTQAFHFGKVGLLHRFVDGAFQQVIAQDEAGINLVHGCFSFIEVGVFPLDQLAIHVQPGIEVFGIVETLAQARRHFTGKGGKVSKEQSVVHLVFIKDMEQYSHQGGKLRVQNLEAQFLAHEFIVKSIERRLVLLQFFGDDFRCDQMSQRFTQLGQVPVADLRLPSERVAAVAVGLVGGEVGIEPVHEPEGTVIERYAGERHVVGIHYAVDKPRRLPMRDQPRGFLHHGSEQQLIFVGLAGKLGVMPLEDEIGQPGDGFRAVGVMKIFETAEADMRVAQPHQQGAGLRRLPVHQLTDADDRQRARGGDAQSVHRLAAQIFPDGSAQGGAAVEPAGEPRGPAAFQVDIPGVTRSVGDFSQQEAASVTQSRVVQAELMPGVIHRQRLRARQGAVAGKIFDEFRPFEFCRVQTDQRRRFGVAVDEIGSGYGIGRFRLKKIRPQFIKRMGPIELFQCGHEKRSRPVF